MLIFTFKSTKSPQNVNSLFLVLPESKAEIEVLYIRIILTLQVPRTEVRVVSVLLVPGRFAVVAGASGALHRFVLSTAAVHTWATVTWFRW